MKFSENKTTGEITLKMSKSEVETFLFENDKLKNNLFNLTLAYFKNYIAIPRQMLTNSMQI